MEQVPVVRLELEPDHHLRLNEAERKSFIKNWIDSSVRPLLGCLPGDRLTTTGVDFARTGGDLTVMALLTERQDLVKRCPWLVELRCVPYDEQWEISKGDHRGHPAVRRGRRRRRRQRWVARREGGHHLRRGELPGAAALRELVRGVRAEVPPRLRGAPDPRPPRRQRARRPAAVPDQQERRAHLPAQQTRDKETRKLRHGDAGDRAAARAQPPPRGAAGDARLPPPRRTTRAGPR
jgi:hypothetical protein